MEHTAEKDVPRLRYRIERDDEPYEDGTPETHPWAVSVIRDGEWSGACRYVTFPDALADYTAHANARVIPPAEGN